MNAFLGWKPAGPVCHCCSEQGFCRGWNCEVIGLLYTADGAELLKDSHTSQRPCKPPPAVAGFETNNSRLAGFDCFLLQREMSEKRAQDLLP